MQKNRFFISILSLVFLFQSCGSVEAEKAKHIQTTQKRNQASPYNNIEKYREIYADGDSLLLYPFEVYSKMRFIGVECGLLFYLKFSMDNSGDTLLFNDVFTSFSYDGDFGERLYWTGKKAEVKLESFNDTLVRTLVKGQTYNVIFAYEHHVEVLRSNVPTENVSGYYIMDIVPLGQKFERQKEYKF